MHSGYSPRYSIAIIENSRSFNSSDRSMIDYITF